CVGLLVGDEECQAKWNSWCARCATATVWGGGNRICADAHSQVVVVAIVVSGESIRRNILRSIVGIALPGEPNRARRFAYVGLDVDGGRQISNVKALTIRECSNFHIRNAVDEYQRSYPEATGTIFTVNIDGHRCYCIFRIADVDDDLVVLVIA